MRLSPSTRNSYRRVFRDELPVRPCALLIAENVILYIGIVVVGAFGLGVLELSFIQRGTTVTAF